MLELNNSEVCQEREKEEDRKKLQHFLGIQISNDEDDNASTSSMVEWVENREIQFSSSD